MAEDSVRLDPIIIDDSNVIDLPDGTSLKYGPGVDNDVYVDRYSASDELLQEQEFTYEEYEEYRREHPEYGLPEMPRPRGRAPGTNGNGNTLGRVVGESGGSPVAAGEANPEVEPETEAEEDTGNATLDGIQLGLDVVGAIPVVGEIADLANAGISLARGDFVGAGLSLVSAIPFVGWLGTGAKAGRRGLQAVEAAGKAARNAKPKPRPKPRPRRRSGKKGGKGRGKKKPNCGQIGLYRNKKDFDNTDTNWDHVPSGRALEQAAENRLKGMRGPNGKSMWSNLTSAQRRTVLNAARNDAYTINIPADVHKNSSLTWGSRNKPRFGSDARSLREAMMRDMDAIEKAMKNADHPCRKQYSAARRAMQRIDPDKHLNDIINITLRKMF